MRRPLYQYPVPKYPVPSRGAGAKTINGNLSMDTFRTSPVNGDSKNIRTFLAA
jgi:hypothetical protein